MFSIEKNDNGLKVINQSSEGYSYTFGLVFGLKVKNVKVSEECSSDFYETYFGNDELMTSHGVICLETGHSVIFENVGFDSNLLSIMEKKELTSNLNYHSEYIPIDRMIDLLYRDLLGRSADKPGLDAYLEESKKYQIKKDFLARTRQSILGSAEFESRGLTVFDRLHSFFDTKENLIEKDLKISRALEAKNYYSFGELEKLSNHEFVWFIYRNILEKEPDLNGFQYYYWLLNTGLASKVGILKKVLNEFNSGVFVTELPSEDTVHILVGSADVEIEPVSKVILGRELTDEELLDIQGLSTESLINFLISKREYFYKPIKVELI